MKKIDKISIVIAIGLFLCLSCTKTLDLQPVSQISVTSFFKTQNDANGALNGMYDRARQLTWWNLMVWGEARSQDFDRGNNADLNFMIRENNLTSLPANAGPNWSTCYTTILDANLILKYIPGITFQNEDDKKSILAQALTMRAFMYYVMVRTWGAVPKVTEPTEAYDPNVINRERTPVADIFALIKKDIDDAIALFPNNTYPAGRNKWSKNGANALKADVYLWTGKKLSGGQADFTTALNACNEIEASDVALLPDFSRVFDYDNKGNKEIIMASNYKELQSGETWMQNMYALAVELQTDIDPAVIASLGVCSGANVWRVHNETRAKFLNDDLRRAASFTELFRKDANGNYTVFATTVQKKFDGLVISGTRRFYDDVVIYRYADIVLLKAEAKNALGQDPSAEINKIRQRAFGANYASHVFVSGTKDANDAAILDERRLEFLYEGKLWWDLLRFGKQYEQVPSLRTRTGQDWILLWPISTEILSLEPKVTQNPGY